ncbi:unnamed protein product, partial [Ixodes hexagonus]
LHDPHVTRIFIYVDNFLFFLDDHLEGGFDDVVAKIVTLLTAMSDGLKFAWELPWDNRIQFLDLQIAFCENHVCWWYQPRTRKSLLSYDSAHSELIKRGIASCLQAALSKVAITGLRPVLNFR